MAVNKTILKDIILAYGDLIEEEDYSFLSKLGRTEFDVFVKALIEAEVPPFDEMPNNVDEKEFLLDMYIMLRSGTDSVFIATWGAINTEMSEDEQKALARIAQKMGTTIYKTERHPEGVGESLPFLLSVTTGNFKVQIESGGLDGWLPYLKDGKGPYKYEDFTKIDVV